MIIRPHSREGDNEEIKDTVAVCTIHALDLYDRLGSKLFEGPDETSAQ